MIDRAWVRTHGLLALAALISPFLFLGGPDWASPPLYRSTWGLGHVLLFALLGAWLQRVRPLHHWWQWLLGSLGVLLVGLAIEFIQSQVGREAHWRDLLGNLSGFWLGLFWVGPKSGAQMGAGLWLGRLVSLGLLVWQLNAPLQQALNAWYRLQQLPVLANFESPKDLHAWTGDLTRVTWPVAEGRYSLAIRLEDKSSGQGPYTGAQLKHLWGDWRGYQTLSFALYSDASMTLTLRINDRRHDRSDNRYEDRFNHALSLKPGWNHFAIPLADIAAAPEGRTMDLAHIQRLLLFTRKPDQSQQVYLDDLRLK
mgnify:CR=1 FL=1